MKGEIKYIWFDELAQIEEHQWKTLLRKYMNPEQLAKSGTEHGEQCALFAWANKAEHAGFAAANDMCAYSIPNHVGKRYSFCPVPELKWLHAIPNAGARGNKVAAAQLKAEGVKAGVADIFLPVSCYKHSYDIQICGLYIELKRTNGVPSDVTEDQIAFAKFVLNQNYQWFPCFGWREAANALECYMKNFVYPLSPKQIKVFEKVNA